ncbi:MAG: nickel transporter [Sulfuricellaceae bacterium]|nr:nickel transporter [Sulfuricellaceae bacterium]
MDGTAAQAPLLLGQGWAGLVVLVFVLGLKHGLDPDHLATIDSLTRINAADKPRLSRWAGVLFSLGHGVAVMAVAAAVGMLSTRWAAPLWLDGFGAWVSIVFLLLLGAMNLYLVVKTPSGEAVAVAGFKGALFRHLFEHAKHPLPIALVGALFAISFDTLSQVTLFSLSASQAGGALLGLSLAAVFMLGMIATDGANGLCAAWLMRRADCSAARYSRILGLAVAGLSLGVGSYELSGRLLVG